VPHTYNQFDYDPVRKCLFTLRCQVNTSPSVLPKIGLFPLSGSSFTPYEWQEGSVYSGTGNPTLSDGMSFWDTTRSRFLTFGGQGGSRGSASVDLSTGSSGSYGTWTDIGVKSDFGRASADYDPVNDIGVIYRGSTGALYSLNCAAPTGAYQTLSTETTLALGEKCGFKYSPTLNGFIAWGTGRNVYLLSRSQGGAYSWSLLSGSSVGETPLKAANGTYNRFRVVTYSDAEIALVINGVTETPYAFRIS
jgi:hypothetical protein